ncbi:oxidoreductase [Zhengella mangrovi]|uniref:Oxidoreductase n=1 Tax=Zhengella mangrovi TaxID=1982044 RepID=A0A2G1QU12_9HYPH|nr:Gfo/Idh/MocA family oxidoreductase [Zhengella mangrovi]PHP68971.1 oxidoreductase [Zhengella mangrovi]
MFRWGILSAARIASEQVIPALCDSENGVVAAIASRSRDKAEAMAQRFGAPHAFDSYDALLASDAVDGVYIPVVTSQHVEWAARAAKAGKHVLVEKPLALKADDIRPLIALREETGKLISEAFMVRYHPQWRTVSALIEEGAIGRLRQVQGVFTYYNTDPANMRNQRDLGGGGLPDIGVYPTVTTRLATAQEPRRVRAEVERDPGFGTDRYANVTADFGEFSLTFYCSTQMALRQSMVFHGEKGHIEVPAPFNPPDYGMAEVWLHDQSRQRSEVFRFPRVRQYKLMAEAFVRAARGEDEAVFTLEDSVKNQAVIDAIFRAGDSGRWETV